MNYPRLFSPITIKPGFTLKNRIFMPAIHSGLSEDGSVNVRAGNGTQYAILRSARAGDTFNYVATAVNGWNAVEVDGQVGWVSGKYSKVV
mgnify:CR=1 FL=1